MLQKKTTYFPSSSQKYALAHGLLTSDEQSALRTRETGGKSETGEMGEKSAIRSSGFDVPKTSNLEPRTLARPAFPARRAGIRPGRLPHVPREMPSVFIIPFSL